MHVFRGNTAPTRGYCLKLIKPRYHLDIRKNSFALRIVVTVLMIVLLHVIQLAGSRAKLTGFCMVEGSYKH